MPNKEDLQFIKDSSVTEAKFGDPDVERVRRFAPFMQANQLK